MQGGLLFISAQNINELYIGFLQDESFELTKFKASPEDFLFVLQRELRRKKVTWSELAGVIVVRGPGSATSLRVTTTIANTLHFALGIPVVALTNQGKVNPEKLVKQSYKKISQKLNTKKFQPVEPLYEKPPV